MLPFTLLVLASVLGAGWAAPATADRKNKKLRYDPEFVHAKKGDVVLFEFFAKNHTVTESSFESPCTRQTNAHGLDTGIDSAFNFATESNDGKDQPAFAFSVEDDTTPRWFYCRQTEPVVHCHQGMVFAISPPPKGNTFAKFQAEALALGKKDKQYGGKASKGGKGYTGKGYDYA